MNSLGCLSLDEEQMCSFCINQTASGGGKDSLVGDLTSSLGLEKWMTTSITKTFPTEWIQLQVTGLIMNGFCENCKELISKRQSLINQLQLTLEGLIQVNKNLHLIQLSVSKENEEKFQTGLLNRLSQDHGQLAFDLWSSFKGKMCRSMMTANLNFCQMNQILSEPGEYDPTSNSPTHDDDALNLSATDFGMEPKLDANGTPVHEPLTTDGRIMFLYNQNFASLETPMASVISMSSEFEVPTQIMALPITDDYATISSAENLPVYQIIASTPLSHQQQNIYNVTEEVSLTSIRQNATINKSISPRRNPDESDIENILPTKRNKLGKLGVKRIRVKNKASQTLFTSVSSAPIDDDHLLEKPVKCLHKSCNKMYDSYKGMIYHYCQKHGGKNDLKGFEYEEVDLPRNYVCELCGNRFRHNYSLNRHRKRACKENPERSNIKTVV